MIKAVILGFCLWKEGQDRPWQWTTRRQRSNLLN